MQYILNAALLKANLLNRTLVIPSFVYARACEYHMYVFFFHTSCGFIATRHREQRSLRRLRNNGQPGRRRGLR